MSTPSQKREHGSAIEIHGFSCENLAVVLPGLHTVLAASGCWLLGSKRGAHSAEYSFEMELAAAPELYCGLVQAGLEMTELSHRMLTELCVLRTHNLALSGPPRVVKLRLVLSFVQAGEEFELMPVIGCSA